MRVGGCVVLNGGKKQVRGAKKEKHLGVVFGEEGVWNERFKYLLLDEASCCYCYNGIVETALLSALDPRHRSIALITLSTVLAPSTVVDDDDDDDEEKFSNPHKILEQTQVCSSPIQKVRGKYS